MATNAFAGQNYISETQSTLTLQAPMILIVALSDEENRDEAQPFATPGLKKL